MPGQSGNDSLLTLPTPCLLLERGRMLRNIARLRERMRGLGTTLRPHLKTCKSWDVAQLMLDAPGGPATVSTLKEAEVFAAHGVRDMIYAVGIAPHKLDRVAALRAQGVDLAVILDSPEQAEALAARSRALGRALPALIEIDSDGHRSGVAPGDRELLVALARSLDSAGNLRGVLTHAGASYGARGAADLERYAEEERAAAVLAAATIRAAGHACPVVSVGSTPTAHFARALDGVTEVRAGVYVFFDLMMANLGVCSLDDIAISVLTTVIGHQPSKGWTLTDSGWMALSRDPGDRAYAFGQVCDLACHPIPDLLLTEMSQEHGVLRLRDGSAAPVPRLELGARVRILPNHACATAAQFEKYHAVDGATGEVAEWPRFSGW